ncbi:cysteine desulfurase family protein [Sporosarcina thermotolerans]|uniref:cysteine desulfurase n=1 Tax=Sporosarcina thermotolerans TaxID=633404 RepID=A0AAW9ACQ6_9BACL|nr:cysteine desulfurase family protein [Sporosarcina thermotolerans]MDW0117433.1 cysteine desulfurase family protein [Sporosarcina thermotolerans]WHT47564.1 cysteine desulfurase family protein [Sporosarcina thermotolerans]
MIYLDHAATTPIHPEVSAAYMRAMDTVFGNPSSIHTFGRTSRKLLDESRKTIAEALHAEPPEIIFTSGGTEADNIAVFGTANSMKEKGNHIITTAIEHHAVLNSCKELEKSGFQVTYLPVDKNGKVNVKQIEAALTDQTILVSIMYGNNEIGTIQPIKEIGEVLKEHQAIFHTDAVQAFGVVELDVNELHVDLLSASAHKLNGPKGVGFLYQRKGLQTNPLLFGGEQERKRRAGTENVPAISAFAEAVKIAQQEMAQNRIKYAGFEKILTETFEMNNVSYEVNANGAERLPHVINISFPGTDIESLLVNMDMAGIAVSSGSACTAGSLEPSHVLSAICGSESAKLRNSVRFSFGLGLEEDAIRDAAQKTSEIVNRLVK